MRDFIRRVISGEEVLGSSSSLPVHEDLSVKEVDLSVLTVDAAQLRAPGDPQIASPISYSPNQSRYGPGRDGYINGLTLLSRKTDHTGANGIVARSNVPTDANILKNTIHADTDQQISPVLQTEREGTDPSLLFSSLASGHYPGFLTLMGI